jgi:hypothetical protein
MLLLLAAAAAAAAGLLLLLLLVVVVVVCMYVLLLLLLLLQLTWCITSPRADNAMDCRSAMNRIGLHCIQFYQNDTRSEF